jgi:uncharacterized membrane protein YfcA
VSTDSFLIAGIALLLSAFIQGMSGVGFSLVAAPALAALYPGPSAIGMVNLMALAQNLWHVWREKGQIHWAILRKMGIPLLVGVGIGYFAIRVIPVEWRPAIVAASSLLGLAALLFWHPGGNRASAAISGTWGGAVNTFAGVGGPPLAAFLVKQGWSHADYVRTQMVVFAALNIVSLPLLGIPMTAWWVIPAGVVIVIAGTALGITSRRVVSAQHALLLTKILIGVVAGLALVRALVQLYSG